jgi:hypothetical protein
MSDYKATPEQWNNVEICAKVHLGALSPCLLELRARVEALEAPANHIPDATKMIPPPVATNKELRDIWDRAFNLRALYNLGVIHGQAGSREVVEPAPVTGALVQRVAYAITGDSDGPIHWKPEARAAILEVARWMREQGLVIDADLLEQEAGR